MTEEMTTEDFRYTVGNGNWEFFEQSGLTLEEIGAAAEEWAAALQGVERPWLCWNVDADWCIVQQRLVRSIGWTPVVGTDPRVPHPTIEAGSIFIDFNRRLRLPTMWMHFPLEFIHLFTDRLAFWHADCLLRFEKMAAMGRMFEALPDGSTAAVAPTESLHTRLFGRQRRYWEVIGCTTRGASASAFAHGCSWWTKFSHHPSNSPEERARRSKYYWDCGAGIRYWHLHCGGKVELIPEAHIAEGHFTGIGRKDYVRASPKDHRRNLSAELSLNNDLKVCCEKLGIASLLSAPA